MLVFIISILSGGAFSYGYSFINGGAWFGCSVVFILALVITFIFVNKIIQRPFTQIVSGLQADMQQNQKQMQNKMMQMQRRGGNPLGLEATMQSMQKKSIDKALKQLEGATRLFKWSYLIKKQVITLRFQLLYQSKKFVEADRYIAGVMLLDHLTVAMVMCRAYEQEKTIDDVKKWKVSKVYKKSVWRLRGGNASFVHSLYAWMLVKKGHIDQAIQILNKAVEKNDDGIISENLKLLKNNKPKQYSMVRYGDVWWSLYLQNPPKQKIKRVTR